MANFNFDVDTSPMARTVESVKGHVNGVTTAVTAMEAAVIATERRASQTICENVDNGFYTLVKSQISQKAVAAYTEMTTKQMTLLQLAKALDAVKKQMLADFNMISKRYNKLFQSLNRALETRVRELDRPSMNLAAIKRSLVFDKLKDNTALVFSASNETLFTAQTSLGGKLKQKTRDAMQTLSTSVSENLSYTDKLKRILVKDSPAQNGANATGFPAASGAQAAGSAASGAPGVSGTQAAGNTADFVIAGSAASGVSGAQATGGEAGLSVASGAQGGGPSAQSDFRFLPVVFSAAESFFKKDETIESVYAAKAPAWSSALVIVSAAEHANSGLSWAAASDEERELVKNEFLTLCEKGALAEREEREIMRLFEQSRWEALKK